MAEEKTANPQEIFSRFEDYVNANRNVITAVLGALVLIVGGYFGFKYLYLAPKEKDAADQMFYAQKYMDKDSLKKALNGDGNYPGFLKIMDDYKWTKAANLSKYYAGVIYLNQGKFDDAVKYLKDFDGDGTPVQNMAYADLGDALTELGKFDEGIDYYKKAAYSGENELTTPLYLKKAALCLEHIKKYDEAKKIFEEIKNKYPNSQEGREAEKYIYRLSGMTQS